jgi:chromosome segregation ATPase
MSDFEQLVRETGFVIRADVGQGEQELVLTVSTLALSGTQVASLENLAQAGFVKADRLQRAEEGLAVAQARVKEFDERHATLRAEYAQRTADLKQENEEDLADAEAEFNERLAAQQRAFDAQLAEAREAMARRQDVWAHERERLLDEHHEAAAAWERERDRLLQEASAAAIAWNTERDRLSTANAVWEARHRAEREGIQARNDGTPLDANPHGGETEPEQAAHRAWHHGWTLRDGLLRLNEHAALLQSERDSLIRSMERAKPEIERLMAENQHFRAAAEAMQQELAQTKTALAQCEGQLKQWRDEA